MKVIGLVYACSLVMYSYSAADDMPRRPRRASLFDPLSERVDAAASASHMQASGDFAAIASVIRSLPQLVHVNEFLKKSIGWQHVPLDLPIEVAAVDRRHPVLPQAVACSADGMFCFLGLSDGRLHMWDIKKKLDRTIGSHVEAITSLACTRDGLQLFSVGRDRTVRMWDVHHDTTKVLAEKLYTAIACSAYGNHIFVAPDKATGRVVELTKEIVQPAFAFNAPVIKVACSADGGRVFSAQTNGRCIVWERNHSEKANRQRSYLERQVGLVKHAALACDAQGERVFSSLASQKFQVALLKDQIVRSSRSYGQEISALACSASGKRIFVGTYFGALHESCVDDSGCISTVGSIGDTTSLPHLIVDGTAAIQELACSDDGARIFCMTPQGLSMWFDYMSTLKQLSQLR